MSDNPPVNLETAGQTAGSIADKPRKRLAILAADPGIDLALAKLSAWYDVRHHPELVSADASQVAEICRQVDVVVTCRRSPRLPDALIADPGRLRYLCHLRGTIKHLASKSLVEAGLLVTNWGNSVTVVAESALALLLCQLKQVRMLDHYARTGEDRRMYQMFKPTLKGLGVGLYGFGPIGRHMARLLTVFGSQIGIYDPFATDLPDGVSRCQSLRELFENHPVISIHCGLNDGTRGSVTGELLDLLPQGGVLINTARGPIVDEAALAERVAAGKILAGVDVICHEGDWSGSPLATLDHAVITRHEICRGKGFPPEAQPLPDVPDAAWQNLDAYAHDQPLTDVITAALYDLKS